MSTPRTLLITGGGTGGHIFPGMALREALLAEDPSLSFVWVGTADRLEARVVPAAGIPFETVDVAFLKGRHGIDRVRAALRLPGAMTRAMQLLSRHRPAAVIGLGGFASGPCCAAAVLARTPLFLLEQNAMPGLVTRALARRARTVYSVFEAAGRHLPGAEIRPLGNPIRGAVLAPAERVAPQRGEPVRILVVGGSQGARVFNEEMPSVARSLTRQGVSLRIRHSAGRGNAEDTRRRYEALELAATVDDFIDDMAAAYAWADLVITRAGATTISELTAIGKPALYVPFPHAADDHQTANALAVVEAGGGLLVSDAEFRTDKPIRLLLPVLGHPEVLGRMGDAAQRLGRPDAGAAIARDLLAQIEHENREES
ncbi:MAG: undecaprenyldiphospho-muramoylpentapeptide beta-N-acetylglucosaminyltransferase [Deltaproteobacteria bacterium]|nr:MAG: undecaprenyldiphospho-muramoylpentapeptide beta-N-acetylglucosaminyltransferase [Deltaproteobacteria bacterium]